MCQYFLLSKYESQEAVDSFVPMHLSQLEEYCGNEPFPIEKIIEFNLGSNPGTLKMQPGLNVPGFQGKQEIFSKM